MQQLCPYSGTLDCVIQLMLCIAQSNAPEDGHNCCPKHVELIWIY